MFAKALIAATVLAASVSAQTHTDCNPLQKTCPANPAIGKKGIDCDFTKGACSSFTNQAGTDVKFDNNGCRFDLYNAKQAPTIVSDFFFFGEVEVVAKAAAGRGIVTALVLQSQDLDEIDWEWVGYDNKQVQSNYFYKGDTSTYDRGGFSSVSTPFDTFHSYGFKWTAEKLEWTIDGKSVRTLTYAENPDHYPQTPMQVKIGTWVAGYEGNNQGTIDWAGGIANFDNAPISAWFKSVKVTDFAGGNKATTDCIKEYLYGDKTGSYKSIKVIKGEGETCDATKTTTTSATSSATSTTGTATDKTNTKTTGTATDKTDTKATDSATGSSSSASNTLGTTPSGTLGTTPSGTLGTTPSGTLGTTPSGTPGVTPSGTKGTSATTPIGSASSPGVTSAPTSGGASPTNGDDITTSTVYNYITHTVTKCPQTVTNCPAKSTVVETKTVAIGVTVCPIKDLPQVTKTPVVGTFESTSTVFKTTIHTITRCGPEVKDCPYKHPNEVVTETAPASTIVHVIATTSLSPVGPSQEAIGQQCGPGYPNCPAPLSPTTGGYTEYIPGGGSSATAPIGQQPTSVYTPPPVNTNVPIGNNGTAPTSIAAPPAPAPTSGASRIVGSFSVMAGVVAMMALF